MIEWLQLFLAKEVFLSVTYWHNMEEKQKEDQVTLQNILSFVTATDRIPAGGFSSKLTLHFLHDMRDTLATASTCDCELRLPTAYANCNYDAFEE